MPLEIDIHFKCYTFEPWDVEYDLRDIATCAISELTDSDIVLKVVLPTSLLFMPLGRMSKICKPCGWNA